MAVFQDLTPCRKSVCFRPEAGTHKRLLLRDNLNATDESSDGMSRSCSNIWPSTEKCTAISTALKSDAEKSPLRAPAFCFAVQRNDEHRTRQCPGRFVFIERMPHGPQFSDWLEGTW